MTFAMVDVVSLPDAPQCPRPKAGSRRAETGRNGQGGVIMRRMLAVVAGLAAAIVVPAGAASARGDGWVPYMYPDQVEGSCGSTVVHVTFPDVKEFQRFLPQP